MGGQGATAQCTSISTHSCPAGQLFSGHFPTMLPAPLVGNWERLRGAKGFPLGDPVFGDGGCVRVDETDALGTGTGRLFAPPIARPGE